MHIGYKIKYALFFAAPLKRVVGVCGTGGIAVGRNTASTLPLNTKIKKIKHHLKAMVLWCWILNIMFL
jgi:hypothetical protein